MDQDNIPWSERFVSILDNIGLSVRLIKISEKKPQRLPTPSVWINDKGNCSLLVDINNRSLLVFDPIKGPVDIPLKDISKFFGESNQLITLSEGLHTPKNRFKLSWLFYLYQSRCFQRPQDSKGILQYY